MLSQFGIGSSRWPNRQFGLRPLPTRTQHSLLPEAAICTASSGNQVDRTVATVIPLFAMTKPRSYLKGIFLLYFYFNGLLMAAFIAKHQKNVVASGAQANVHASAFGAFFLRIKSNMLEK